MRIAIAATTPDESGKISRRGGRADCYLVFDETATLREVMLNPFKDYDRAVGVRVADYLAEKAIDVIAAGNFGSGFLKALDAKGVHHVESEGNVGDIAKDLAARFGIVSPIVGSVGVDNL
jgi:predicted Fe-Mo cluster-binding NifX family protein